MSISLIWKNILFHANSNELITTRFTNAVKWTLLGSVISRIFSLLSSIGIGRILGIKLFGQLGLIQNLIILIGTTLSAGISISVTKLVAEHRDSSADHLKNVIPISIWISTFFGICLLISLFLIAPWLSLTILKIPQLENDLKLSLFFLLFSIVNGAIFGIIAGMEEFRASGLLYSVRGFLFLIFSIAGVIIANITGAIIGLVISELFSLIINVVVTNSIFNKKYFVINYFKLNKLEAKNVVGIAFPSLISRLIVLPAIWFTSVLLVNQTSGLNALGLFNAADKLRQLILFLPITISGSILPILSNLNGKGNHRDFKKIVQFTLYINLVICSLPLLLLLFFSKPILSLYGEDFMPGSTTLQLLTLSTLPNIVNIVYGQVLISLGQIWKRTFFDILLSIAIVVSSIYLIPKFLDNGLALSYLIAYTTISFVILLFYYCRLEKTIFFTLLSENNEIS